jgi:hypothetical protein
MHILKNIIVVSVVCDGENRIALEFPLCPVQKLPGHGISRTTEKYTYFTAKGIQNMRGPFDDLQFQKKK